MRRATAPVESTVALIDGRASRTRARGRAGSDRPLRLIDRHSTLENHRRKPHSRHAFVASHHLPLAQGAPMHPNSGVASEMKPTFLSVLLTSERRASAQTLSFVMPSRLINNLLLNQQ